MSLHCTINSYLTQTPISIAAFPYTIGLLVRPDTAPSSQIFSALQVWNGLSAATALMVNIADSDGKFGFYTGAWGRNSILSYTIGRWYLILLRAISTTNQRCDIMGEDGSSGSTQITASLTMDSTIIYLGTSTFPNQNWRGDIANYFLLDADIQPGGAATQAELLRQLFYRGPFSIPRLIPNIVEYRSFRSRVTQNDPAEVYYRRDKGVPSWTNTNGVLGAYPQPPQAAGWVEPWSQSRLVPVYVPDEVVVGTARNMTLMGAG